MSPKDTAVIFDLDGTLVDSLPGIRAALNSLLRTHGRPPASPQQVSSWIGDGAQELVERAFAPDPMPPGAVGAWLTQYDIDAIPGTHLFPGARALLSTLEERHRLVMCTNKPQAPTEALLDALQIRHHFESVIGGDALPWRKPDPRHVTTLLEWLDIPPHKSVFIGDSPTDAAAAHAASVPLVLLTHGYSRQPVHSLGAAAICSGLHDVDAAVTRTLAAAHQD